MARNIFSNYVVVQTQVPRIDAFEYCEISKIVCSEIYRYFGNKFPEMEIGSTRSSLERLITKINWGFEDLQIRYALRFQRQIPQINVQDVRLIYHDESNPQTELRATFDLSEEQISNIPLSLLIDFMRQLCVDTIVNAGREFTTFRELQVCENTYKENKVFLFETELVLRERGLLNGPRPNLKLTDAAVLYEKPGTAVQIASIARYEIRTNQF